MWLLREELATYRTPENDTIATLYERRLAGSEPTTVEWMAGADAAAAATDAAAAAAEAAAAAAGATAAAYERIANRLIAEMEACG